ncbi:MAG: GNAT family N-acetyltransferase, partial [Bacteroidaceae bacterium]|nr:GNAT family N-acetyltransferase [Bacteroidaceae bacterium]
MSEHNILLQTRHLWKTCFGDSEAFMDIYFSKKYTPASNIVRQADGTVVAATQLLPYVLGMYGK